MGFKSQLNHYQKMQLSQAKYLNDMADAFQNRTKSTHTYAEKFCRNRTNGTTDPNMNVLGLTSKTPRRRH